MSGSLCSIYIYRLCNESLRGDMHLLYTGDSQAFSGILNLFNPEIVSFASFFLHAYFNTWPSHFHYAGQ